jgi:hypothetical protein
MVSNARPVRGFLFNGKLGPNAASIGAKVWRMVGTNLK